MAPITRSSVQGRPLDVSQVDEQSHMVSQLPSNEADDQEMADDYDEDSVQEDPQSPYQSTAQEILQPLQDTADRVSRQVEDFAKALDKFVLDREPTDQTLWDDAFILLERYSNIAETRRSKTPADEADAQIQKIQLEAHLWILVRNLLSCNSPEAANNVQIAQESRLGGLHRYSGNVELWTAFLDSDAVAQEYECILGWLQERAADTSRPIEDILRKLIEKSERGDGVWSAGPIYTQTAIKQQKRTRVWSMPLEPSNPGLNRSHVRKTDHAPLVAQLDPDARSRESAVLQEQDEYHEQAAWQTCWEMLRRGQTAAQIRSWWAERKEVWRYSVLQSCIHNKGEMADSPWFRILSLSSNSEWFGRCEMLAQNPAILDRYQKAVYGILCGDTEASKSISKTVDDHLFCIFNALLIKRYQSYLQAYNNKLTSPNVIAFRPQPPSTIQIRHYSSIAQSDPRTKDETHLPHRFMEMAIVSKDFDAFFVDMGQAAAHVAHTTGQGSHIIGADQIQGNEIAKVNAQDQDSVRMVAHLQLVLRSLGLLESSYADHEYEMENNIANYISWLESHGKFSLIPLYAAKLSEERCQHVLGAILINVTDARERDLQVKLMKQYNINVPAVAYGIFSLANFNDIQRLRNSTKPPTPPRITVSVGIGKVAQLKVRPNLMTGEISEADEKAIRSVEWCRYVDAENWGSAAWAVTVLYKVFLCDGRFVALRQLLERVSLSETSLAAVGMNLNFADGEPTVENGGAGNEEQDDEDRIHPISPSRKRKDPILDHPLTRTGTDRETLAFKSLIWRQLEQLVAAIDSLDAFQYTADNLEANRSNPSLLRANKRDLKKNLDDVRQAMQPLFDTEFLCQPQDDMESILLRELRNHYIPECTLAYNSALWFAGHYLSRAWLVECMQLAQLVAQIPMLTNAFIEGGRMKELVRAFAVDSQALLQATEQTGSKAKKLKADQGNGDIWKVSWKEQSSLDLEAVD
ncbi:uncharacterized protein Z518_11023 [Rhinocladiella mackenziei CBS 650.93]|uniref:Nuclear pore complex protein n=1 Tax=Rhinocladiella mackenziei CBS 650.93 TaxID=1442369 RepID=A0A0D2I8Q4_9EURO|nr:uncharacterized protein Z518_11023 [Rhinocladiella mackenziei CBS 650.93]KIW99610.1 hypothetical protein Z518_11023 [Rhinocladiella mackenziei CBS 650.93]